MFFSFLVQTDVGSYDELRIPPRQHPYQNDRELPTLAVMYSWPYQEYIRGRVCNSRSFCYGCCHGRISFSSSLPRSVCPKKRKHFYPRALNWTLNIVLRRTRACKDRAQPELPVKTIERLERASMHLFSGWAHSDLKTEWYGCASSMTHLKFCRGRPLGMKLHTLPLMSSWPYGWSSWLGCGRLNPAGILSFFFPLLYSLSLSPSLSPPLSPSLHVSFFFSSPKYPSAKVSLQTPLSGSVFLSCTVLENCIVTPFAL